MAKKNYRPTAAQRKKVADKQLAEKQAHRRAVWQKNQKQIIIGAVIAVVAIIAIALAVDYFYVPANSVRSFLGKPLGLSENAIVRCIDGKYYEFGTVEAPAGYAAADYGMDMTSEPYETFYYYETTEEGRAVNSVYVTGVENREGANMATMLVGSGLYQTITDVRTVNLAGYEVHYVYTNSPISADEGAPYFATLVMYVNSIADSCVLVTLSSAHMPQAELPTEEAMFAEAEAILSAVHIKK